MDEMNVHVQQQVALVWTVNVSDAVKTRNDVVMTTKNVLVLCVDAQMDEMNVRVQQQVALVWTVNVSDVVKINNHDEYARIMGYLLGSNT